MTKIGEQDAAPQTEILLPGTRLGRYVVSRRIGAGGMGVVYEGVHEQLGKRVAIKTLNARFAATCDMQTRFVREGEAVARIRHPNVVVVDDVGVERGTPYLVMEYLEGRDLGSLLRERGRIGTGETLDLLLPVVSAVSAAHEHGIVHRDLKPENIFVADTPHGLPLPKVLDFGISKLMDRLDTQLTGAQTLLGSPHYISPEQADSSASVDATTDIYSLGVILYQCVSGRVPFDGSSLIKVLAAIAAGHPRAPRSHAPDLPADFGRVILRAMSVDRSRRYQSARALGAALLPFASQRMRLTYENEFLRPRRAARREPEPVQEEHVRHGSVSTLGGSIAERRSDAGARRRLSSRERVGLGVAAAGLAAAAVLVAIIRPRDPTEAPPAAYAAQAPADDSYVVKLRVEPRAATIALDGVVVGQGSLVRELQRDGRTHTLLVAAAHHVPQTITFRDAPPPEELVLTFEPEGVSVPTEVVTPAEAAQPRKPARATLQSKGDGNRRAATEPVTATPQANVEASAPGAASPSPAPEAEPDRDVDFDIRIEPKPAQRKIYDEDPY